MTNTQNNQISTGVSVEGNTTLSNETGNSSGSADNTTENAATKDPEKNKKLTEIKMSEQLRETYSLKITIPKIIKGLHTNSFLFMDVVDDFYEKNYPELVSVIADKKFARYAGFKKGRFFIDNVEEFGGVDGWGMEIDLNPLAPSLGSYNQMQQEAEKALIQAIKSENQGSGNNAGTSSGSAVNVSGNDCDANNGTESNSWAGHRCNPPKCTAVSKEIHGNSSRQYAKDTVGKYSTSEALVNFVGTQVKYQLYGDNPYGAKRCPEAMWTGPRPIRGNCADFARMLKCILDVNGYNSIICHIPGHFYNAIWENGDWTVCDLCALLYGLQPYGHANHGNIKPRGTWDNPIG